MSPMANPFHLLIPASTGLLPVLSATSLTWSSQHMVDALSFQSNSWTDWRDLSPAWANGCTKILAVKFSKAFIIIKVESLLVFDEAC